MTREELDSRYQELLQRSVSDMTVQELRDTLNTVQQLEFQLHGSPQMSKSRFRRGHMQEGVRAPRYMSQHPSIGRQPQPHRRVSEQHVGRYVMTVLAACLCLLALGVFIMSFWMVLPDVMKFLIFVVLCGSLEVLGFWRSDKSSMRPFWLGVAGLGVSGLQLVIIAGSMVWVLYDTLFTGLLSLAWFGFTFFMAHRKRVGVFYAIAYIGGMITTGLACLSAVSSVSSEVVIAMLVGAIVAVGYFGWVRTKMFWLLLANQAYCWFSLFVINEAYANRDVAFGQLDISVTYEPQILAWFMVAILGFCVYNTCNLLQKKSWGSILINAGLTYINCGVFLVACETAAGTEMGYGIAGVCIVAMMLFSCPGYILGSMTPLFIILHELSEGITSHYNVGEVTYDCGSFLPAVAVLAFCAIPALLRKNHDRAGVVMFAAMTCFLATSPYYKDDPRFYILTFALLVLSAGAYVYNVWRNEWYFSKHADWLVLSVVPAILIMILSSSKLLPEIMPFVIASVGLQLYWVLYLERQPAESRGITLVAWYVFRVLVYLALLVNSLFPDEPTKVLLIASLMLTVIFNVYQMVHARTAIQSVVSCIMANWHMWLIMSLCSVDAQLIVSLLGLVIGASFIFAGFYLGIKAARNSGLVCCILYVLKMGIFDISGGGLGTAGGLLLAGLLCFGISFAYNKALKVYDNSSDEE